MEKTIKKNLKLQNSENKQLTKLKRVQSRTSSGGYFFVILFLIALVNK